MRIIKTKNNIFLLILIVYCFFVWFFIGEMSPFHFDFIVAHGGLLWKGKVDNNNLADLISRFPTHESFLMANIGNYVNLYNNVATIITYVFWILFFISIFLYCIFIFVLFLIKKIHLDVLPFIISIFVTYCLTYFIFLIPNQHLTGFFILINSSILFLIFVFIFIISNIIINKIKLSNENLEYASDLKKEDLLLKENDKNINNLEHIKDKNEKKYLED